jgi:hypothetical protein
MPKRDRFGIYQQLETLVLLCLRIAITAALSKPEQKPPFITRLRIEIEVCKQLIRVAHELGSIEQKDYLMLSEFLIECSKMSYKWLESLTKKEPQ